MSNINKACVNRYFLACYPLLLVVAIASLGWQARRCLGHWPVPMIDTVPSTCSSYGAYSLADYVVNAGFLLLIPAEATLLFSSVFFRWKHVVCSLTLHVLCWGGVIWLATRDPQRVVSWWID